MRWLPAPRSGDRLKRIAVFVFVVAVPWVPGGVALAMLLSGEA